MVDELKWCKRRIEAPESLAEGIESGHLETTNGLVQLGVEELHGHVVPLLITPHLFAIRRLREHLAGRGHLVSRQEPLIQRETSHGQGKQEERRRAMEQRKRSRRRSREVGQTAPGGRQSFIVQGQKERP